MEQRLERQPELAWVPVIPENLDHDQMIMIFN